MGGGQGHFGTIDTFRGVASVPLSRLITCPPKVIHTQGHSHPSSCTPNVVHTQSHPHPRSSTPKVIHIQGHSHPRSRHTCANYVRDHLHPTSSTQKFHIHPRSFTCKVIRTHVSTPHPRSSHIQKKRHGSFRYERNQQNAFAKAFQSI